MSPHVFLSHELSPDGPAYGSNPPVKVTMDRRLSSGDTCNTAIFEFHNHSGTHVDAPLHFDPDGRAISDYRPEEWFFDCVTLVDIPVDPGVLIGPERLESVAGKLEATEFLLLRTGFERYRGAAAYVAANPGLAPPLADWLCHQAPMLRGIGIDSISISSFRHREVGREAHRRFLGPDTDRPVLLVEDMSLAPATQDIVQLSIFPIRVRGTDGAPCTAIAELGT